MKKSLKKTGETERKPRRLTLNRETIKLLEDPALLEAARGGTYVGSATGTEPANQCT